MSLKTFGTNRKSRLFFAAILGVSLLVAALTIGSAGNANADSAVRAKKTKVLGAIGRLPEPMCPLNCSALAIVSGFQAEIDGVGNPYRIPFDGYVTKWKIALGSVNKTQRDFFEEEFGRKPKAGISILKPTTVGGKKRYKLEKRSPIVGLNKYLGDVTSIALDRRIKVKKGWYVALTVPTWAPALASFDVGKPPMPDADYSWRASRDREHISANKTTCDQKPNMKNSEPQQEPGSKRQYGCRFSGEQLLYRVKVTNK